MALIGHIGHAHGMVKVLKHRRIVGRVTNEQRFGLYVFQRHRKNIFKQLLGHREFVVLTEPAVDMN